MDFFPRGSVLGMTGMLDSCSPPLNLTTGTVWWNATNYRCCSGLGCMNVVILFLNNIINKVCLLFNWAPGQATRTSLQAQGFPLECDVAVLTELFEVRSHHNSLGALTHPWCLTQAVVQQLLHGWVSQGWSEPPKPQDPFPWPWCVLHWAPAESLGKLPPSCSPFPNRGSNSTAHPFGFVWWYPLHKLPLSVAAWQAL